MVDWQLVKSGKVCDIYESKLFPNLLVFNRTDRFSVGDKVFPGLVKDKGMVLNQMSLKWMKLLEADGIIESHIIASTPETMVQYGLEDTFQGTAVVASRCIPIPLEAIVRGYYVPESKSWDSYKKSGVMYGNMLPHGLKESEKLPWPIYTPSTKAAPGEHDRNIGFTESINVVCDFLTQAFNVLSYVDHSSLVHWATTIASAVREMSLNAYKYAHAFALKKGIILADAKLEFGLMENPFTQKDWKIVLIDEAFTPDSSRFWDVKEYAIGKPQASMDKQFLRRYVYNVLKWDGNSNPPQVPNDVLVKLSGIYQDIYEKLFDESILDVEAQIAWEWYDALVALENRDAD